MKNIYLIGFMGTGKSTVSGCLAKRLGYEEIDTDEWIVMSQGRSIPEIFDTEGEVYFRELETDLLRKMRQDKKVISCGGGMALRKENVSLMKQNGIIILLTAEPKTVLDRVKQDKNRPLLNGNMNTDYIRELMEKRNPYYKNAADIVVATDNRQPEEIADEIIQICFDF